MLKTMKYRPVQPNMNRTIKGTFDWLLGLQLHLMGGEIPRGTSKPYDEVRSTAPHTQCTDPSAVRA